MALANSTPPSSVDFPSCDPTGKYTQPSVQPRLPYLPFRRISLPTAPSLIHRESVVSVASFDSLPEEGAAPASPAPAAMRHVNGGRRAKGRPMSIDGAKRGNRMRELSVKPVNEARESTRRKVIDEFYETERAYVDGLELIYSHFLTPIIASLDTDNPLLPRAALTSIFSNFIDIWNLHRSFFSSLSALLSSSPSSSSTAIPSNPPPLSPILLSHFPYLSLYTPFVTSFPSTISSLMNLITPASATNSSSTYNPAFAAFLSTQESDPRCGRLKLRDWLLTIVQRCPRYLLLLKDLINCTDPEDPEHAQLISVHTLVSKITSSLNTSLHTHAQTLSLLALQRSTPNLPFQLIVPGRTLLKRGPLLQVERSAQPWEREFLLFSDCMIWLAGEDAERGWKNEWGISRSGWSSGLGKNGINGGPSAGLVPGGRPGMVRSRSKSEAELSTLKARVDTPDTSPSTSPSSAPKPTARSALPPPRKSYHHPVSNIVKRQPSSIYAGAPGSEDRWVYKGRAELVDLEVIVSPPRELGEERRFEVLSPEGSFVLYAATELERDEWTATIRQAKAQLLVSLNVTHPNSTLTSSSSTNHLRRSLQALPFPPSDERIGTFRVGHGDGKSSRIKGKKASDLKERRGRVEHWVPAIWIPDAKTEGCMRCGRTFGWRRRRHHCRLCGRCVCAACSGRTFFISDPSSKDATKPARACNACYETVFPLLDPPTDDPDPPSSLGTTTNTMASLNNFPSWLSMPSLPVNSTPEALMAIDPESSKRDRERGLHRIDDQEDHIHEGGFREGRERVRMKSVSRPRSYHQILEDFEDREQGRFDATSPLEENEGEGEQEQGQGQEGTDGEPLGSACETSQGSSHGHAVSLSSSPVLRREDTARRNKRFSMPAVALQTTSVTARTQQVGSEEGASGAGRVPGRGKRFSLVLGRHGRGPGRDVQSEAGGRRGMSEEPGQVDGEDEVELGQGIAAGRLSELLGRKRA